MPEAKDATALAKEQLAKDKEAADRSTQEATELLSKGKPTPTQEENDLAKLGAPIESHEDDGSGPDVKFVMRREVESKQVEAKPQSQQAGYQTRSTQPKPPNP